MIESRSGLIKGDITTLLNILNSNPSMGNSDIEKALDPMILSASGWRKIFAASGDEEDDSSEITPKDIILAGIIGLTVGEYFLSHYDKPAKDITLVVACDSRPTGPLLADAFMRTCSSLGLNIRYVFISAAPEVMAYARTNPEVSGFAYISASHNPIGHNGFKFGMKSGGVLDAAQVGELIDRFLVHCRNTHTITRVRNSILETSADAMEVIFQASDGWKDEASRAYRKFSHIVLTDSSDESVQKKRLEELRSQIIPSNIGVLGELNGSARTLSIDGDFLEDLKVKVLLVNNIPRQITHRIVPEGRSLNLCRDELEKAHQKDPAFILGYVPDNDGDRGNIVYVGSDGRAKILEAQQVFALVALAESAWLEYSGQLNSISAKAAIAVNGPTSMRIDEIARTFGLDCYRAEVGEANVVGLAAGLRDEGYIVRLMGEGSNGGNITYPAAVRDPLNTLGSIIKLLSLRGGEGRQGLFEIWCRRRDISYSENFTLEDVLKSLPEYITTSAYEDRALMKINSTDHVRLKSSYEKLFLKDWDQKKIHLAEKWGITDWEEINTEGGEEKHGFGPEYRSAKQKGGLKILFSDADGTPQAYLWMRGSGTEPVYRVLVDVKGPRPELENELLNWQRDLIQRADVL